VTRAEHGALRDRSRSDHREVACHANERHGRHPYPDHKASPGSLPFRDWCVNGTGRAMSLKVKPTNENRAVVPVTLRLR
jgi:hypothetical protein